jgi:hypothetical protein
MKPSRFITNGALALGLVVAAGSARANQEAEDLKRQIESQRAAVYDLERVDDRHQVGDEITLLKSWLDESWSAYSSEDYKKTREVIDRCLAQAELIRQKTAATKLTANASERETSVRSTREKIERTKKALLESQATKKALEMNAK